MFCRTPPTKFLLSPKKLVTRDQPVPGYFRSERGGVGERRLGTRLGLNRGPPGSYSSVLTTTLTLH